MIIYIINFLLVSLYGVCIRDRKKLTIICTIQMFLILALRSDTLGVDLYNYKRYFEAWKELSLQQMVSGLFGASTIPWKHENGFVLFNYILGNLGLEFHGVLIIFAAICMTSVGIFIYRYSDNPALSFILFLSLQGYEYFFGILRQSLGLAFFLFAIPYLKERKIGRYILLTYIAAQFHMVFYLTMPLVFLSQIRLKREYLYGTVCGSVIVTMISPFVLKSIFNSFFDFIGKDYKWMGFEWNNMYLLIVLLILFVAMYYKENINKGNMVLTWGLLYALPIQTLAFYISILSRSAIGIFLPFAYVIYPNTLRNFKNQHLAAAMTILSYILLFIFYLYVLQSSYNVPYISIFNSNN